MTTRLASLTASVVDALSRVPVSVSELSALTDAALMQEVETAATILRLASTHAALLAGEVARRSAPKLGGAGLAQRSGFRTPDDLLRVATGSTRAQATQSVRVGILAHDSASPDPQLPWLQPVSTALLSGRLSLAGADAIRLGLGVPTDAVPTSSLADAASRLAVLDVDADRLYRLARDERDALDEAGIADRAAALREQRSFRLTRLQDGMSRATWMLDPESAASVTELFDRATSPRRGGPRFVNSRDLSLSDAVLADTRTTEQLASDVMLELLVHGAAHDSSTLLSTGAPVVRVIASSTALDTRQGHGWIEAQHSPVSIETVERLACAGAVQRVTVHAAGQPLHLGREQRLFSRHQRVALAIRDGGCRWPGCDRPPSWTEAHHTRHWARDGGPTDVSNGILLCRFHHLTLHNNHWEIRQKDGEFWLVPPPKVDGMERSGAGPGVDGAQRPAVGSGVNGARRSGRAPIPMPSKSPLMREMQRGARA